MRVLLSTTAGSGHFGPLVPLGLACRDGGHEVRVAAPASFAEAVRAAGFDHVPFADAPPELMGSVFGRVPELSFEEANAVVIGEVFGRLDAQAALPEVTAAIERWRPDIVVREPCELASLVAAERAGVAQAQVAINVEGAFESALPVLEAPLAELDELAGLPSGAASRTMMATPELTWVPKSIDEARNRPPAGAVGRRRWRFRNADWQPGAASPLAAWGDPLLPLVYVSYGSVTGGLGPMSELYAGTLAVLADAPVRVLMTTGPALDPASLEPWPANALVERWRPQAEVMAHAAAVVDHGGFGTAMAALAAGLPQVVIPLFAFDQRVNAERIAAAGAGIHLEGGPGAVADLPADVTAAVEDPSYRDAARAVAAEIAELPDPATAVPLLERLAAG